MTESKKASPSNLQLSSVHNSTSAWLCSLGLVLFVLYMFSHNYIMIIHIYCQCFQAITYYEMLVLLGA